MSLLTLTELQSVNTDRAYDTLTLPNPDRSKKEPVEVRIQSLYPEEYIELINSLTDDNGKPIKWRSGHLGELMVARSWVDENGKRVMADEDIKKPWWRKSNTAFVTTFISKAREFNAVTVGEGVADSSKNSEETDSAD